jgi:hypothetical protein
MRWSPLPRTSVPISTFALSRDGRPAGTPSSCSCPCKLVSLLDRPWLTSTAGRPGDHPGQEGDGRQQHGPVLTLGAAPVRGGAAIRVRSSACCHRAPGPPRYQPRTSRRHGKRLGSRRVGVGQPTRLRIRGADSRDPGTRRSPAVEAPASRSGAFSRHGLVGLIATRGSRLDSGRSQMGGEALARMAECARQASCVVFSLALACVVTSVRRLIRGACTSTAGGDRPSAFHDHAPSAPTSGPTGLAVHQVAAMPKKSPTLTGRRRALAAPTR